MNAWSLSLHDVAPATWPECAALLEFVAPYAVPVTLLVTPDFHGRGRVDADPAFVAALRARLAAGDEIVLHGLRHVDEGPAPRSPAEWLRRRILTASEGEFAALDAREAARRLDEGLACLARAGLPVAGFVPPAWLLGPGARAALAKSTIAYTSTRDRLYRLPDFAAVDAPSLVWSTRAAWRRTVSRHWNARRLATHRGAPRLRVALHPAEARYPTVLADWARLLDVLAATRSPALETAWLAPRPVPAALAA